MTPFLLAEKALMQLCDDAAAAGDQEAHAALFDALQAVRAVGGWKAFPVLAPALGKPSSKSANALRQERYRAAKRNAQSVTGGVTSNVTRNASSVTDGVTGTFSLSSSGSENIEKEAEKEEEKREENARDVTRNARNVTPLRGTRITPDFAPSNATVTVLKEAGFPDPLRCLPAFRDYWTAKPGKDGCKLDWEATFRNWVRNERTQRPAAYPARHVQPSDNRAWKLPEEAM